MPGGNKQLSLCEVRVVGKPLHEDPEASAAHDGYLLAKGTTKLAKQARTQAEQTAAEQAAEKVQAKAALEGSRKSLDEAWAQVNSTTKRAREALDSQSQVQAAVDEASATLEDKMKVVTDVAIPERETTEDRLEAAARNEANNKSTYELAESQLSETDSKVSDAQQQFESAKSSAAATDAKMQQTAAQEEELEKQVTEAAALLTSAKDRVSSAMQQKATAAQEHSTAQTAIETTAADFEAAKTVEAKDEAQAKSDQEAEAAVKGFVVKSQQLEVQASKAAQKEIDKLSEASKSAKGVLDSKKSQLEEAHQQQVAAQAVVKDAARDAVRKQESQLQELRVKYATVSDELAETKAQIDETTNEQLNPEEAEEN
jgi:hypothetical protein